MSTEEILTQALGLPHEARALLAEKLLESLNFNEGFEVSQEWRDEIKRRCDELDKGLVVPIPGDEVFEKARKILEKCATQRPGKT